MFHMTLKYEIPRYPMVRRCHPHSYKTQTSTSTQLGPQPPAVSASGKPRVICCGGCHLLAALTWPTALASSSQLHLT